MKHFSTILSTPALAKLLERRVIRFASVGFVSTVTDIIVFQALYGVHLYVQVAATVGFLAGMTVGFILNSRFVFKAERTGKRYVKYAITSFGGLLITNLIIFTLYTSSGVTSALVAKLIAVAIVFVWNYTWSKYWAFA